jgi:hypothetical protein
MEHNGWYYFLLLLNFICNDDKAFTFSVAGIAHPMGNCRVKMDGIPLVKYKFLTRVFISFYGGLVDDGVLYMQLSNYASRL